ncbi:hypothetical protein [Brevundimonas subvibrioides]|uniref:Uncharacterized protein n=1 Tax=Brevundimonas subvibrioides (strain ATCC 15264 / DSM 4735 / LMG 14903 / NBRC 16000 / CB 81) TaxID=633149 RepID=D9QFY6_BRESC|nr:hypothetical protein [Brevundimonas subvibrioides]ADL00700.1 hypothetical protein Bresu_1388 [Brevundimonas subvibrioides ATCC 15264]
MIRIGTNREPVTVTLRPPYGDVTVTLKRLTTSHYGEAQQAAQAILRNDAELLNLLVKHDLLPEGGVKAWKRMKDKDVMAYAAFLSGIGVWLGAVECAVRGISEWTGILGEDGKPAAVEREIIETLMLDEALSHQITTQLDQAARILFVEGER